MPSSWDVEATEAVGKALPNEFSKLAGWLRYVPWIGQALQILGAVDAGATAYADTKERNIEHGMSSSQATQRAMSNAVRNSMGAMGGYANPGIYGSEGKPDYNWADYAGMASSLWGGGKGGYANLPGKIQKLVGLNTADEDIDYGLQTPGYFDAFWNEPQSQPTPETQYAQNKFDFFNSPYIRRDTITYG